MARFGYSFKMEQVEGKAVDDLVFNTDTRTFDTVISSTSIPQTVDHFLKVQIGELQLHPSFGIDIFGIMTSETPHTLMLGEIEKLKDKLNFALFEYSISIDGRSATIEAELEEV